MSDKEIKYTQQIVARTLSDNTTTRDNQLTINSLNISRVDTTGSENRYDKTKVYGNYLQVKSPHKMGKLYIFLFHNSQPIFAIGPQCNLY